MNKIENMFFKSFKNMMSDYRGKVGNISYTIHKIELENCYEFDLISENLSFILNIENGGIVEGYIPDFIIRHTLIEDYGYVIEIDGFEWHEKTKEQAINDRKKDRCYLKNGFIPIRFLGSEVYHDVENCIEEIIKIIIETELIHYKNNDYKEWESIENFIK